VTADQVDRPRDGPRLLVAAFDDLYDTTGIPREDVAGWWRQALVAYRADPKPATMNEILRRGGWEGEQ